MLTISGEDLAVRLNLDYALTLTSKVGVWGGLDQRHLRAQIPRMNAVHAAILALGDRGLPHLAGLDASRLEQAVAWVARRRAEGAPVVVLGEPGAVAAVRALSSVAPDPGALRWVDGIDGAEEALAAGDAHLLVLDGPPWVRWLAARLAGSAIGLTLAGEGAPIPGLEGAERLNGPCDARFGVFGAASLAVAELAGARGDAILEEATRAARRVAHPALFENPAYLWAAVLVAGREHGLERLCFLLPTGRLEGWAAWGTRMWAAVTTRAESRGGVRRPTGIPTLVARLGDEAMIQHLLGGPHDVLGVAVTVDDLGARDARGHHRWGLARALLSAQIMQLCRDGRPVVQLRLPSLDPAMLAGLSMVTLHAAIATALASDLDPLSSPAAQQWRTLAEDEILNYPPDDTETPRG